MPPNDGAPAAGTPPPAAPSAPPAAAAPPASASGTLVPPPAAPDWATGFKNAELSTYVANKKFQSVESLAESYKNLEAKLSTKTPDGRTVVLPEKMEGDAARAVWEQLGAPKDPKGYEFERPQGEDPKFYDRAEAIFHKYGITKEQAKGIIGDYKADQMNSMAEYQKGFTAKLAQADQTLKMEWGQHYERNIEVAKQGVKILGLDANTLDTLEALQGREALFKTLQKIGEAVGESNFVDGGNNTPKGTSPEEAYNEIEGLRKDQNFVQKLTSGDAEATKKWRELHEKAYPGTKTIG